MRPVQTLPNVGPVFRQQEEISCLCHTLTMPNQRTCGKCGSALSSASLQGYCLECLGEFAFGRTCESGLDNGGQRREGTGLRKGDEISPGHNGGQMQQAFPHFGDFELLEETGRGGMGVVWKARQKSLNRVVALKCLPFAEASSQEFVKRFRAEASAAAGLQHPNIVAIHEVGVHEGRHYFAMEFVAGETLSKIISGEPLPPKRTARYVSIVAGAIEYAHQHGILHRDLKPSNILIDAQDQPRVTDFGLAKRLDEDSELTVTGQVLGSPNYMPPEQAQGGKATRRSDVYALGAILYHCITGRPPFQGARLEEVLRQVVQSEALAPRLLNRDLPADLETICLRCLETDPSRRYATAQELADELNRFLRDEPIHAQPVTFLQRGWRWCRRKPGLASALVSAAVLLAVVAVGSPIAAYRINVARAAEQASRLQAEQTAYVAQMNLAQQDWEQNNINRLRRTLEETAGYPRRGFEWFFWQQQIHQAQKIFRAHLERVGDVALSPDHSLLATASNDRTVKLWEFESGRELGVLEGHMAWVRAVDFSPDGQRILSASNDLTARVWDVASRRELLILQGHTGPVLAASFSPDGRLMATGGADGTAILWNSVTGKKVRTLDHGDQIWALAFSPDSRRLLTAGGGGDRLFVSTSDPGAKAQSVRLWELESDTDPLQLAGHEEKIWAADFSSDGKWVVTGSSDGTAQVWNVSTGEQMALMEGHKTRVFSAAFSRDSRRIVTGCFDGSIHVWNWDGHTAQRWKMIQGHSGVAWSTLFLPDNQRILTGSGDGTARLWDLRTQQPITLQHPDGVWSVAFLPHNQNWIVTTSSDGIVRLWDLAGDRGSWIQMKLDGHNGKPVVCLAVSPDGQWFVTGGQDNNAVVWDVSGEKRFPPLRHSAQVQCVAVSPDGRWIATGSAARTVKRWEASSGREILPSLKHDNPVHSLAFASDSGLLATASRSEPLRLWETATGNELKRIEELRDVAAVAFSADSRFLLTSSVALEQGLAKGWDRTRGRELFELIGHNKEIRSIAISPDGQRIATASLDQTARIWEAERGSQLLTFQEHAGEVKCIAFEQTSRRGQRIATASLDGTVKIWTAATPEQVRAWQQKEEITTQRLLRVQAEAERKRQSARREATATFKHWMVLGPLNLMPEPNDGLDHEQIPEENRLSPKTGDAVYFGGRQTAWRILRTNDFHLDFNSLFGPDFGEGIVYAVCYIDSNTELRNLRMLLSGGTRAKAYLNGRETHRRTIDLEGEAVVAGLGLRQGLNVLVLKLLYKGGATTASARFTDEWNQPVSGLRSLSQPF